MVLIIDKGISQDTTIAEDMFGVIMDVVDHS